MVVFDRTSWSFFFHVISFVLHGVIEYKFFKIFLSILSFLFFFLIFVFFSLLKKRLSTVDLPKRKEEVPIIGRQVRNVVMNTGLRLT